MICCNSIQFKNCVKTQISNYVKFDLLINQSSIAILKWDLALETITRVTTRDNTTQHEYNTTQHEATRAQHQTTRVQHETTQVKREYKTTQNIYNTRKHKTTWVQYDTIRVQHDLTQVQRKLGSKKIMLSNLLLNYIIPSFFRNS